MKLHQRRILRALVFGYLLLVVGTGVLLESVFLDSYERLENDRIATEVRRARQGIESALTAIAGSCADWSCWDHLYAFVEDRNPSFLRENGTKQPFRELRLNLMLIRHRDGRVVHAKTYDPVRDLLADPPPRLVESLLAVDVLFRGEDESGRVRGIVATHLGPMLVSANPILTSLGTGPSRGTIVFGRYLDDAEIAEMGRTLDLEIGLISTEAVDPSVTEARRAFAAGAAAVQVPLSDRRIAGFVPLADVEGRVIQFLRVVDDRSIHKQGLSAAVFFFVGVSVLGAVAAILLGFLLYRLVDSLTARESSERLRMHFFENSSEGILLIDRETRAILQVNASAARILGRRREDFPGRDAAAILGVSPSRFQRMQDHIDPARGLHIEELTVARGDGKETLVEALLSRMSQGDEPVLTLVCRDLSERQQVEERKKFVEYHDPMTGLPNRTFFQERVKSALEAARRENEKCLVIAANIDRFKEVNDTFGHEAADCLLKEIAGRIKAGVRRVDLVARAGGDAFLVFMPGLLSREEALLFSERLLATIRKPFRFEGRDVMMTASLGVAVFPEAGESVADLLQCAEAAMHHVKTLGRDSFQVYDPAIHDRSARALGLRSRLAGALDRDEFRLVYQPQVDVRTGRLVAVEALIRWESSEGLVAPLAFIPVAEDTGLIISIGEWVLKSACAQAVAWRNEGLPPLRVAVNLSTRQLTSPGLIGVLEKVLDETGLAPEFLELEITESLAIRNSDAARDVLTKIRAMGLTTALDDFGTGYSSLSYLRQFPIDRLKMDRSFLQDTIDPGSSEAIISAIIDLAHAVRMEVIAEGVETDEHLAMLKRQGCDLVQGFGVCRPQPPEKLRQALSEGLLGSESDSR